MENRHKKKRKTKNLIYFTAILFFIIMLLLYFFKDLIPRPRIKSSSLVLSPKASSSGLDSLKKKLLEKNIEVDVMNLAITSSTLVLKLDKNTYVYLDSQKNTEDAVNVLIEILRKNAIENPDKEIKYIDLRFEKAVVKYK